MPYLRVLAFPVAVVGWLLLVLALFWLMPSPTHQPRPERPPVPEAAQEDIDQAFERLGELGSTPKCERVAAELERLLTLEEPTKQH